MIKTFLIVDELGELIVSLDVDLNTGDANAVIKNGYDVVEEK